MKTINSFFSNKILSEEKIEFDNKGRAKGYFALALDAKSRNELNKQMKLVNLRLFDSLTYMWRTSINVRFNNYLYISNNKN